MQLPAMGEHTREIHAALRADPERWQELPLVGIQCADDLTTCVELRACSCGSTIGKRLSPRRPTMQFKIYRDHAGEFRWRLVAANEKTVADSAESYTRHEDAYRAAITVQTAIGAARIVDASS
jgi:uncharacterized protein YegP (UPF0339 family)